MKRSSGGMKWRQLHPEPVVSVTGLAGNRMEPGRAPLTDTAYYQALEDHTSLVGVL